jgi:predicted MFS family arabinose efflux permease
MHEGAAPVADRAPASAGDSPLARFAPSLAFPQFRDYWITSLTSLSAQQISTIAIGWLIYDITRDAVYLGYAGLATAIPGIAFSLFGGVFADRVDLRRLMGGTQLFMTALMVFLGLVTAAGIVTPWQILIVAFLTGTASAFNNPARQAVFPQLVDRSALASAVSLNAMSWQGTRVIAPAAGGVLLATAGAAVTFFACAVGFLFFAAVVFKLRFQREASRGGSVMSQLTEGVGFVITNALFGMLIGLNFFNSFFGISLLQIFPVYADEVLDVGPSGLGLMYSCIGVGSVAGLVLASALSNYERRGLVILGGAVIYGLSLIAFSLIDRYAAALFALFFVGATSQIYMNAIQTAIQLRVPDQLRGRVMGIYTMTYNMGPLGAVQAGIVAASFGPPASVQVGGVAIILLAVLIATMSPRIRKLGSPTEAAVA